MSIISKILKYLNYEALFFLKYSKFNVDSKNAIKVLQNVFGFLDNCVWIGGSKFFCYYENTRIGNQRVNIKK